MCCFCRLNFYDRSQFLVSGSLKITLKPVHQIWRIDSVMNMGQSGLLY